MNPLNQFLDNLNIPAPFKKIAIITIVGVSGIIVLLFISALTTSKKTPKQIPPPVLIFSPVPSSVINLPSSTTKPRVSPSTPPLSGLSVATPVIKDNFIYYLSDGGTTFYKASLDGRSKQALSENLIAQIKEVVWSPDRSSAILKIENNKYFLGKNNSPFLSQNDPNLAITYWYYNFADKNIQKLDSKIGPVAYSPSGDRIAYIKPDQGGNLNKLYISNPNGTNEQSVAILPELIQNNLIFLDKNNILTFATPEGYGRNFIYSTNLTTKTTQKTTDDGFTFGAIPSPKGNLFLAQTVKPDPEIFYKKFLSVVNIQNKTTNTLEIPTDLSLAAWSLDGNTFYAFTSNKLWVVDANNLSRSILNLPAEFSNLKIDGSSTMISPDNSTIFFTSNNKLYSFQLK